MTLKGAVRGPFFDLEGVGGGKRAVIPELKRTKAAGFFL